MRGRLVRALRAPPDVLCVSLECSHDASFGRFWRGGRLAWLAPVERRHERTSSLRDLLLEHLLVVRPLLEIPCGASRFASDWLMVIMPSL